MFADKWGYLEQQQATRQAEIADEEASRAAILPPDEMLAALKEWWEPLLRRGRIFRDGVGGPVRYTIGELDMVVDFPKAKLREYAGEETSYWFTIPADLVSTNIRDREIDWSNSIFLSMQFQAGRVGKFNEFIYTFMKCLSRDRIEYVENWYAEQSDVSEDVQLGDWVVQRRCPHLRADLSKTGKIEDGVLTCSLHDWKWDLDERQVPDDARAPDPLAQRRGRPLAGRRTHAAPWSSGSPRGAKARGGARCITRGRKTLLIGELQHAASISIKEPRMTTVPVGRGAVGVVPSPPRTSPIRRVFELEARAEAALKVFLQRWSIPALRVALGGVFVVFGALKFVPGMSPLELLVQSTWERLTFGMITGQTAMVLTAIMEVSAGALLDRGRRLRPCRTRRPGRRVRGNPLSDRAAAR